MQTKEIPGSKSEPRESKAGLDVDLGGLQPAWPLLPLTRQSVEDNEFA
jgi:hypothetical protein